MNSTFITSYERDNETDLDFAEARFYNFNHGRFTSVDPLMASASNTDPQTWNRYVYVLNNPYKYVDPTGESPSTHTDKNGRVYEVTDDDDLGVYRHDDIDVSSGEQVVNTSVCGDNCVNKVGETEYWDEFREHNENGDIGSKVAQGARIIFGTSFDADISRLNQEAKDSSLGAVEVAYESTTGGNYDIKNNKDIAPHGANTGRLLNGKYATARSAGNYLAGYNGATTKLITPKFINLPLLPPIPYGTKKRNLTRTEYMRIAGGLHKAGKTGAVRAVAGKSYGSSPYYGEIEHAGRRILAGFRRGERER